MTSSSPTWKDNSFSFNIQRDNKLKPEKFASFRKLLGKTQKEISGLLGVSLKAVCSYEQGWRNIPVHVERQILFLVFEKKRFSTKRRPCWEVLPCSQELKERCPAWEFNAGDLCWFINGTICKGVMHKNWTEKIDICKKCRAFPYVLREVLINTSGLSETE